MISTFSEAHEALDGLGPDDEAYAVVAEVREFVRRLMLDSDREWNVVLADRRATARLLERCDGLVGSDLRGLFS